MLIDPADCFSSAVLSSGLRCELAYQPPLDWRALIAFLGSRSTEGVECTGGDCYARTVRVGVHSGWVTAQPSLTQCAIIADVSLSLAPVFEHVVCGLKRLFDLEVDPRPIAERLGALGTGNAGLRVPGAFDGFEMSVRAILGQQVSVKAATTLAGRLVSTFGEPIDTPVSGLTHHFPRACRLACTNPEEIAAIGLPRKRAGSIVALAREVDEGRLQLDPSADVSATVDALKRLPGIGEWTAHYVAMRSLSWSDAFPHTDLGIMHALGETNPHRILEIAEAWRPWRSYAVIRLWKSLEDKTA